MTNILPYAAITIFAGFVFFTANSSMLLQKRKNKPPVKGKDLMGNPHMEFGETDQVLSRLSDLQEQAFIYKNTAPIAEELGDLNGLVEEPTDFMLV